MNVYFKTIIISLISLTALCVVTLLYIFIPVATNLAELLNISNEEVAELTSFFGVCYAFGFLIWGGISDRFGRENIIIFGLISLSIITFILPLYSNYTYIFTIRCMQGFFASSFPPVILVWIAENLDEKYRKIAISLISCAFLLAGTIGQWFGSVMIKTSITVSMYTLATVYLCCAFVFYVFNKQFNTIKNSLTNKISLIKIFIQIPNIVLQRKLIKIYFSSLFVLMSFVCLYVYLYSLTGNASIKINQLRTMATLGMLVSLLSSWLYSRIQVSKVLASSLFVMSITFMAQFLIISKYNSFSYALPLIHFAYVSSIALAIPSMITCSSIFSSKQTRGIAISLYTCILFIGASLGSILSHYISVNFIFIFITAFLFIIGILISKIK